MVSKPFTLFGDIITLRLTAEDSSGQFTVFETEVAPHGRAPLHSHTDAVEISYVVEGRLAFQVGDVTKIATTGTTIYIGKNVPHCYRNLLPTSAKLLALITPAGIESLFEELQRGLRNTEHANHRITFHNAQVAAS